MKGLIIALQFLTRFPLPRVAAEEDALGLAMRWFPAAGLVIGAAVAGAAWIGLHFDPWVSALLALAMWIGVTGALHLDGLADIADASAAAHADRERLLIVLKDPHVGSFAVIAIVLQLLAKLILLRQLVLTGEMLPLILVPFAARIGPLLWARWLPPLHEGLGARVQTGARVADIGGWTAMLLAAGWFVPVLLAAPLLILLWGWRLHRTFGGISGDGHGAGIELVETGLLIALLIANRPA